MICKSCKKKVEDTDIYCLSCGLPLERYRQQFNLKKVIKQANDSAKNQNNTFFTFNVVLGIVLVGVICWTLYIGSANKCVPYIVQNLLIIFIAPLFMLQFAAIPEDRKTEISLLQTKKHYPRLLFFTFLVAFYFFFLKFICEGFFISLADPILNLVRLVLVLWGLAIAFPVPMLIIKRDEPVIKLIYRGYIAGKYLRWHQFSLCVMMGAMSMISCVFLFLFLPTNMRFNSHLLNVWYKKQEEFKLYDRKSDY